MSVLSKKSNLTKKWFHLTRFSFREESCQQFCKESWNGQKRFFFKRKRNEGLKLEPRKPRLRSSWLSLSLSRFIKPSECEPGNTRWARSWISRTLWKKWQSTFQTVFLSWKSSCWKSSDWILFLICPKINMLKSKLRTKAWKTHCQITALEGIELSVSLSH